MSHHLDYRDFASPASIPIRDLTERLFKRHKILETTRLTLVLAEFISVSACHGPSCPIRGLEVSF